MYNIWPAFDEDYNNQNQKKQKSETKHIGNHNGHLTVDTEELSKVLNHTTLIHWNIKQDYYKSNLMYNLQFQMKPFRDIDINIFNKFWFVMNMFIKIIRL